jgi:hypothetical protein
MVLPVPGTEKSANPPIYKMGLKEVVTGIFFEKEFKITAACN